MRVFSLSFVRFFCLAILLLSCKKSKKEGDVPLCSGEDCYYINVTTVAGNNNATSMDGPIATATFNNPTGVVIDALGNIYVADYFAHKIRKISNSGVVTTLAGSGNVGSIDDTGSVASFNYPFALALDASENIYVADLYNNKIRKVTPTGVVTTLAGSGSSGSIDGIGTAATFQSPSGIAIDPSGDLFVVESSNKIRKISPSGVVTTFAGNGDNISLDGNGLNASFGTPYGICADANGNLFVTDLGSSKIRKVTPSAEVTTIAGSTSGYEDGITDSSKFNFPFGIACDLQGNLFVAD